MARKRQNEELYLAMNGNLVARLKSGPGGELQLTYEPTWLESDNATPISLMLPLSPAPLQG